MSFEEKNIILLKWRWNGMETRKKMKFFFVCNPERKSNYINMIMNEPLCSSFDELPTEKLIVPFNETSHYLIFNLNEQFIGFNWIDNSSVWRFFFVFSFPNNFECRPLKRSLNSKAHTIRWKQVIKMLINEHFFRPSKIWDTIESSNLEKREWRKNISIFYETQQQLAKGGRSPESIWVCVWTVSVCVAQPLTVYICKGQNSRFFVFRCCKNPFIFAY